MATKLVKFTFIKEDATFSQRQKDIIEMFIKTYNWDGFKDLISVDFLNIEDNYFLIKVDDTKSNWHGNMSKLVCNQADLHNFILFDKSGNPRLFEALEEIL